MSKFAKLRLINYLIHEDITIDLINGVNIIGGESGTGKSSIRCAIEDLCWNEDIKNCIREGSKKAQIILTLSDGTEIEKVFSASINRYILRIPGEKEQQFDKIGKSVPDEIKKILELDYYECDDEKLNLNVASQMTLPFLLDQSPTFRMKLFNQLTGNANIDELLTSYNKDIFNLNREIPTLEKSLEEKDKDLTQKIDNLQILSTKVTKLQKIQQIIKEKYVRYEAILSIFNKIKDLKEKKEFLQYKISQIKIPEISNFQQLREKIEFYDKLKSYLNALQSTKTKIAISIDVLKKKVLPDLNSKEIEDKIKRYEMLKTVYKNLLSIKGKIEQNNSNLIKINKEVQEAHESYEALKQSQPKCDKCGQYLLNCKD